MALKDTWVDLEDAIEGVPDSGDEVSVEPINKIAHAVIFLEENGGGGGTGEPGKSPYIGDNGNWFEYNGTQYVDTGVKAQGEDGKDGVSGLPKIYETDDLATVGEFLLLEPFSETRITVPVTEVGVMAFMMNQKAQGVDQWSLVFTVGDETPTVFFPIEAKIEWAVAEPTFTAGYTYYLSFIPLKYDVPYENVGFEGTLLGVWVAKELS